IVNPFLERIDIDRLPEIAVGVHVIPALGRGSQSKLHGGGEVLQNASPVTFVVRTSSMTLVDHNEVKEIRRILTEIRGGMPILWRAAHEGLENREKETSVRGYSSFLADRLRIDARKRF